MEPPLLSEPPLLPLLSEPPRLPLLPEPPVEDAPSEEPVDSPGMPEELDPPVVDVAALVVPPVPSTPEVVVPGPGPTEVIVVGAVVELDAPEEPSPPTASSPGHPRLRGAMESRNQRLLRSSWKVRMRVDER